MKAARAKSRGGTPKAAPSAPRIPSPSVCGARKSRSPPATFPRQEVWQLGCLRGKNEHNGWNDLRCGRARNHPFLVWYIWPAASGSRLERVRAPG